MPTVPLPPSPNLDHLRRQARELQRAVRTADPAAIALVAELAPERGRDSGRTDDRHPFPLQRAQLVVARRYGFPSWSRLKHHVELVTTYSREPDRAPATDDPVDELLRLACLTYGDDDPARRAAAGQLLDAQPELRGATIHAAAATASVADVERLLARDPDAARREGGPHRWEPLFYLAYARVAGPDADAVLQTAALLIDAGADVNAGYLWHGLPTAFTVLTGVFGGGEMGLTAQPPHPAAPRLARLLLDAGADPNERQGLYNRQFFTADDHLELLFEFGLGTATADPWGRRLGSALQTPAELVREQLRWAVTHHQRARVQLLAAHGVDVRSPFADGHSPTELAMLSGDRALADDLVALGAPAPSLTAPEALVAAVLAADRAAVDALILDEPDVVDLVRHEHPSLVVRAAVDGDLEAVRLAVALGFDVNARGRTDAPIEQPWETALHHAAGTGDAPLAELLLALGADPDLPDARFDATPLHWARHADQAALVRLLEPRTGPP